MKRSSLFLILFLIPVSVFAEDAASSYAPILGQLAQLAIEILSPVLLTVVSYAAWKLAGKFGIEKNEAIDRRIRSAVQSGIDHAEQWAKTQAEKPSGEDRKLKAVEVALRLASSEKIKGLAQDKVEDLVESLLGQENKKKEIAS